jgi:hypothetical protein
MAKAARRRSLRLLRSDPLPPIPCAKDLLDASTARRPGEHQEVFLLSAEATRKLSVRAAQAGLPLDVAASLALEAGMLIQRWPEVGDLPEEDNQPLLALPAASARYLRSLTVARKPLRKAPASDAQTVAVPVRLLPRIAGHDAEEMIEAVDLEQAISWEIASVLAGQTMSEWVLERLLLERQSPACSPTARPSAASRPAKSAS